MGRNLAKPSAKRNPGGTRNRAFRLAADRADGPLTLDAAMQLKSSFWKDGFRGRSAPFCDPSTRGCALFRLR